MKGTSETPETPETPEIAALVRAASRTPTGEAQDRTPSVQFGPVVLADGAEDAWVSRRRQAPPRLQTQPRPAVPHEPAHEARTFDAEVGAADTNAGVVRGTASLSGIAAPRVPDAVLRIAARRAGRRGEASWPTADAARDIHTAAKMLARLKLLPAVRASAVARVRQDLARGTYREDEKLEAALDAILEDLRD